VAQDAGGFRRQLKRGLVRFQLGNDLVAAHRGPVGLQPLGHGHFRNGFAHGRNLHFNSAPGARSSRCGAGRGGTAVARLVAGGRIFLAFTDWVRRNGGGHRRGRGAGHWGWHSGRAATSGAIQLRDDRADANGFALGHPNFQHAIGFRRQLKRGLVRFQLGNDLVALHGLAVFFEPLGNGDFGDGFANGGNFDFEGHEYTEQGRILENI